MDRVRGQRMGHMVPVLVVLGSPGDAGWEIRCLLAPRQCPWGAGGVGRLLWSPLPCCLHLWPGSLCGVGLLPGVAGPVLSLLVGVMGKQSEAGWAPRQGLMRSDLGAESQIYH